MYEYVVLIGWVGVVFLLLILGLRSFDADSGGSDSNPPRFIDDAKDQQSPTVLTQLADQQKNQTVFDHPQSLLLTNNWLTMLH